MKKIILIFASMMLLLGSCGSSETSHKNIQWEYDIVSFSGSKTPKIFGADEKERINKQSAFLPLNYLETYEIQDILNNRGKEGWELVNVYTTEETVFPNFGEDNYHTGIKSNTRTNTVNFVFKRVKLN